MLIPIPESTLTDHLGATRLLILLNTRKTEALDSKFHEYVSVQPECHVACYGVMIVTCRSFSPLNPVTNKYM